MWLLKMAWNNLWRNPSRTLITIAAIFFAVILSVTASSLKKGIFDNLVKNVVSFYTGYIQVHKQGYQDEQILDNSFILDSATKIKIKNQGISGISPRLESFALASYGEITRGCMVVGIDPESEDRVTSLKNKLTTGQYLKPNDNGALVSEGMAEKLKIKYGDTIVLIGQGYHGATAAGKYPVLGILKFGAPQLNDRMLYLPLATAQYLFSAENRITSCILWLEQDKDPGKKAVALRSSLGNDYEVMTWKELLPDIRQHIESDTNNMKFVQGILYLLICFGIFSTLLMMMVERKYELGMLVAIGMRKSKLMLLLLAESTLAVITGCIAGILVSIPLIYYLNRHPIRLGGDTARAYERFGFEAIFPASTDAANFIDQALIVLVIGCFLSLYPLYKILRLDPVSAMKK